MQIAPKTNNLLCIIFLDKILGIMSIDTNKKDYSIDSIPEKQFTENQVLAYYFSSWHIAVPKHLAELGLDYGKKFKMAMKIS